MKIRFLLFSLFIFTHLCNAQDVVRREIRIPDIPGYQTLKCDFHMHTVFSDGNVWPSMRVTEAWRDGLDAFAITDHIEYQPHKKDLKPDHNRSFEIAAPLAEKANLILIKGSEITRGMPPGHLNALFLKNSQPLDTTNWKDAVRIAHEQGAFIFWNHPGWKAQQPDTMKWFAEHSGLLAKGFLQGIEVVNNKEWYPKVLDWAIDSNLTLMGNSDIHDPVDMEYTTMQRPLTLVFSKERSEAGIREALFAKRTAVIFNDTVMGRKEILEPLFYASAGIVSSSYRTDAHAFYIQLYNRSDIPLRLAPYTSSPASRTLPESILIPGQSQVIVRIPVAKGTAFPQGKLSISCLAKNYLTGSSRGLEGLLSIEIPK